MQTTDAIFQSEPYFFFHLSDNTYSVNSLFYDFMNCSDYFWCDTENSSEIHNTVNIFRMLLY